ncbi:hypothetical protein FOL47_006337 [Perkinsus chesapeaki]|uniref:C3H1-type domain-containing protein n=1 Tax=Perkinsus chesapeaki TaxID=330153 RepID=A0A7J6LSS4_PERCH|nr:hypothetical protein FOL47_006337 [Perkinsus chesapeaki]
MQPSIRNTFLTFDDEAARAAGCQRRQKKSRSLPAKSTCDRQKLALTSLLYRAGSGPARMEAPQVSLIDIAEADESAPTTSSIYRLNPLTLLKSDSNSTCSNVLNRELSPSPKAAHSVHKKKGWPSHIDLDRLSEDHRDTLLAAIPQDPISDQLLSCGSIPHILGACRPCVFARNFDRPCQYGAACLYCHYPHEAKKRTRKTKKQRAEAKLAAAAAVMAKSTGDEDLFEEDASPIPSENTEQHDPENIYRELMDQVMLVCAQNFGITPKASQ